MKLRNIFIAITVTLVAIVIAAPAGAQLKCKAKQNKKTGVIEGSHAHHPGDEVSPAPIVAFRDQHAPRRPTSTTAAHQSATYTQPTTNGAEAPST